MIKKIALIMAACLGISSGALAAIRTETVDYTASDGQAMQGYVAYDDAAKTSRPGILIAHDWMGIGQFTRDKAVKLAKEGYVAFAVDVHGKGIRPGNVKEAGELSTKFKDNRPMLRAHMVAAYDKLTSMPQVDARKIVVMGYCFGGTAALELARSGVPLAGTVTFHGGLSNPTPEDARNIKGRVLVLHGADDPHVPPAEVNAFKQEMKNANVNMTFIAYPGAVHAFTNPKASSYHLPGVAYNKAADKASWKEFEKFLNGVFK